MEEAVGTYPNQPVLGLELLLRRLVVIDQRKTGAATSTKVCPEAEGNDTAGIGLVDARKLLGEIVLGDVRAVGVENVDDELAAGQQPVRDELARPDRDGCRVVSLAERIQYFFRVVRASACDIRQPAFQSSPFQPFQPFSSHIHPSSSTTAGSRAA